MPVLLAFQRARWPPRIDNPFAGEPEAAEKLKQAVKDLNRGIRKPSIRFGLDGAHGIKWERAKRLRKR
jgi:hypothetical protein